MSCMGLSLNATELHELRDFYRQYLAPSLAFFRRSTLIFTSSYAWLVCLLTLPLSSFCYARQCDAPPFNLFLICIAICDATLMATYLLYKHVEICHPWFFTHIWIIYTRFYAMFSVFVHSTSLWITVNMAGNEVKRLAQTLIICRSARSCRNFVIVIYLVLFRGSHPHTRIPPCNSYPAACIAIIIGVANRLHWKSSKYVTLQD
ncbi:hypothetical protein KIN20_005912 [Parelaphostrongylus tenuis]|uniref:Uncharacterized protein n=1 Tax=Parelaphostrongylus tenuis TaxID=148309 RepID=A0AAD5MJL4_PARTN|nr:hypothetical protein KIN20_005912 [Parelaphostrongylus tenuis]